MTYFKLDIPRINETLSLYKNNKRQTLDTINLTYNSLGYIQSGWNDSNSNVFLEKIKKDKYEINNYFNYLDSLHDEINYFKENINDICYKYGYKRNSVVLKFDDNEMKECKNYLNTVINLLNNSLNQIDVNSFGSNFEYINLVYTLRSEIKSMRSIVNDIINDLTNFTNQINNEVYNSKFRMKRIANYDFPIKTINYNWNVVYMDTKK